MDNIAQAFDGQPFDPSQYKDEQQFEQLPKGEYILRVTDGDVKETKSRQGKGAQIHFEVVDGEFAGQSYMQWYNLRHVNKQTEEIGQQQFAALVKACGLPPVKSTDELLGKYLVAKIGPQKKDPTSNEIKAHKPIQGQLASASSPQPPQVANPPSQPAQAAQQPAQSAGGKLPWER